MNKFLNKEEWGKIKPWMILGMVIIAFYLIFNNFNIVLTSTSFIFNLLMPLIMAIAFAFLLNIPMVMIEKFIKKIAKKQPFILKQARGISVTLTIIFALIVVSLIISILIPKIAESLVQLFGNMGSFLHSIIGNIDQVLEALHIDFRLEDIAQVNILLDMPWNEIFKNMINFLGSSANGFIQNATSFTMAFLQWFMAFMFSLYLLNGKETLLRQVRELTLVVVPKEKAKTLFIYTKRANTIFRSFVTGQLTEAVIISAIYYVGMIVFKFPYPELIALIIGLFSLVPVFGPMCAMAIGALLVLSVDPLLSFWFIIFFQILSQIEDNLIYPRVVGNSVGLPGLWVMLSIFILGDLFGVVGMITAVPITAFVYSVISDIVHHVLHKRNIKVDYEGNINELHE